MTTKTDYVLIGVGVLAAVLLVSYAPGIATPSSGTTSITIRANKDSNLALDDIPGIDVNALNRCRNLGLM